MTDSITIETDLPHRALWPNNAPISRGAKMGRAAKAAAARKCVELLCGEAAKWARPMWPAATVKATFYFKDNRPHDPDNAAASIKHHLDGIADAGIIVNDRYLTPLPPVLAVDAARPRLELVITMAPGAAS